MIEHTADMARSSAILEYVIYTGGRNGLSDMNNLLQGSTRLYNRAIDLKA